MKILVVNENRILLKLIVNALTEAGHTLFISENGYDAFEIIDKQMPDIVIMDLLISYVTGYELIDYIRSKEEMYIKIVILSQVGLESAIENAFNLGVDDYILLPLKQKELIARIDRLSKYQLVT